MPKLLSNRVKVTPSDQLSPSRYQYVELNQTQPALGTPLEDKSVLISNVDGTTEWVPQNDITGNVVPNKNTIYVSKSGSDSNVGNSISSTKLTIKGALSAATAGTSIIIYAGDYTESNPLILPENVSIIGQDSRVNVIPKTPTSDVFKLNSGSSIDGITVVNHKYPSFAFSLKSSVNIKISPIINNCSSITGPFLADGTLFVPYVTIQNSLITPGALPLLDSDVPDVNKRINTTGAGGGIFVDGNQISSQSLNKTVIVDQFIAENQGGIGIHSTNNATIIVQNSISKFCTVGFKATNGGYLDLTSCSTEYGVQGIVSDGYYSTPYINNGIISASEFSYISDISITNQGSGYASTPTVKIGNEWANGATVSAYSQIYYGNNLYFVITGGTLATPAPTFTTSTPTVNGTATLLYTGTAATATATMSGGKITEISFTPGNGYTEIPTISIIGSNTTPAEANAALSGISLVTIGSINKKPHISTIVSFQHNSNFYYVTEATNIVGTSTTIKVSPEVYYVLGSYTSSFYYESRIIANGHTSKYIGSGITLNALPGNSGRPIYLNEVIETNYGKVFYSGINDTGLYKIGDIFTVDSITGVSSVNSDLLDLTNVGAIGPLNRSGVISGVQLREISDDVTLTASTGLRDSFTAPTQHAVYTYLQNNYLSLTGGIVSGNTTINDLILSNNSISSKNTNQNIVLNPNGTGKIDLSTSRVINAVDPVDNQDLATKAYVDLVASGGLSQYPSLNIGNFYIHGNEIENVVTDGGITLTSNGTGITTITSTIDSTSVSTGSLVVNGGVGIAKSLYVGIDVHAPTFYGDLSGAATSAGYVTNGNQSNITQVGSLLNLTVDNINIDGNTIKNTHLNTDLVLGITGTAAIVPETADIIDFGKSGNKWGTGYFTNLNGTIQTSAQPNISSLSNVVSMYDATYNSTSALKIGYAATNNFELTTTKTNSNLLNTTTFTTHTTGVSPENGKFEFYPNGQLSLTIENGRVAIANDLAVGGDFIIETPIFSIGKRSNVIVTSTDFGIRYNKNINIKNNVSSLVVVSDGTANVATLTLTGATAGSLGITTNSHISLSGSALAILDGTWAVTQADPGSTTVLLSISPVLSSGTYSETTATFFLNSIGFFGYDQSLDAFTFTPNSSITSNVVSGTPGKINADITSSNAIITGGAIDSVEIGGNTAASGTFTNIVTGQISNSSSINILHGNTAIIDSFDSTMYESVKYVIKIKDTVDNHIFSQEMLLLQDGTNILTTEYAILSTNGSLGTFGGNIDGNGFVNLTYTPNTGNSHSVTIIKFYI